MTSSAEAASDVVKWRANGSRVRTLMRGRSEARGDATDDGVPRSVTDRRMERRRPRTNLDCSLPLIVPRHGPAHDAKPDKPDFHARSWVRDAHRGPGWSRWLVRAWPIMPGMLAHVRKHLRRPAAPFSKEWLAGGSEYILVHDRISRPTKRQAFLA